MGTDLSLLPLLGALQLGEQPLVLLLQVLGGHAGGAVVRALARQLGVQRLQLALLALDGHLQFTDLTFTLEKIII